MVASMFAKNHEERVRSIQRTIAECFAAYGKMSPQLFKVTEEEGLVSHPYGRRNPTEAPWYIADLLRNGASGAGFAIAGREEDGKVTVRLYYVTADRSWCKVAGVGLSSVGEWVSLEPVPWQFQVMTATSEWNKCKS